MAQNFVSNIASTDSLSQTESMKALFEIILAEIRERRQQQAHEGEKVQKRLARIEQKFESFEQLARKLQEAEQSISDPEDKMDTFNKQAG
ncbi:hypothetical protein NDU88_010629 [Pleurodeles waltl]|uniref:Uncharacterized protein n=1 Tax=Pleurodeles waltl TaxID=8319 RepID=A0AAV7QUY7_PLEWA|nr:hypothetical protein NDU88_010629 [Pleurodeles waltl]